MSETTQERKTMTDKVKASSFEIINEKYISVTFKFPGDSPEGYGKTFKSLADRQTWKESDFEDDETVMDVTWESVPPKAGREDKGNTNWLMKWNGKEKAPFEGGNRKGGYPPKTPDEIHGGALAAIVCSSQVVAKSLCDEPKDYEKQFGTAVNSALETYFNAIKVVRSMGSAAAETKDAA